MGSGCAKGSSIETDDDVINKVPVVPEAIHCIMGIDVDRACALYQHSLLCLTELLKIYVPMVFPGRTFTDIHENYARYIDVCTELYNDLTFNERKVVNHRADSELDGKAKQCLSWLAYTFTRKLPEYAERYGGVTYEAADHEWSLSTLPVFETCYEDTLKLVVTDLERSETWQIMTFVTNKAFHDHLKEKDRAVFDKLCVQANLAEYPPNHDSVHHESTGDRTTPSDSAVDILLDKQG